MIDLPVIDDNMPISMGIEQVRYILIDDYERHFNLPRINSVELIGNKTSEELGLESETEVISQLDIYKIFHRTIDE